MQLAAHAPPCGAPMMGARNRASRRCVAARTATADAPATTASATSGLKWLPEEARARATDKKANKFEKVKAEKCGSAMWTEVPDLAAKLRAGTTKWEDLSLDDVDVRMKFAGLFHRGKRTPKRFMMRLKVGWRVFVCVCAWGGAMCAAAPSRRH